MLAQLNRYGAVAVKVRAMYGARVTRDQYEKMAALRTVAEVIAYLRANTGWSAALDGQEADPPLDRLERLLRRHYFNEYLRLFPYMGRAERVFLRTPVLEVELEQIMRFLRMAAAGRPHEYAFDLPPFFDRHSSIDYVRLTEAETYEDMLEAVSAAPFHKALLALRPEGGGFPSYLSVETAMRAYAFRELLDVIEKRSSGGTRDLLRESVNMRIDWFNFTVIGRVLEHYPHLADQMLSFLLPFTTFLKPARLRDLCAATSPVSLRARLEKTHYGKFLREHRDEPLETCSQRYQLEFYRRRLTRGLPSPFSPTAYLELLGAELRNLIHVLECVRYGLSPQSAMLYLVL